MTRTVREGVLYISSLDAGMSTPRRSHTTITFQVNGDRSLHGRGSTWGDAEGRYCKRGATLRSVMTLETLLLL
jgi:hypothetical protein